MVKAIFTCVSGTLGVAGLGQIGEPHVQTPGPTSWALDVLSFVLLVAFTGELKDRGLPHTHTVGASHTLSDRGQTHTVQIFGPVGFSLSSACAAASWTLTKSCSGVMLSRSPARVKVSSTKALH